VTFLVRHRTNGTEGVLKVLKNKKSTKARGRMRQEVTNLEILGAAGCKVPALLDDNAHTFREGTKPLFLVMERIEGQTLSDLLRGSNSMTVEDSITVVLALCDTVERALEANVVHRDIKPENIVVRSLEDADVVMVDYGLSFNSAKPENITGSSETIDNSFLSLPESRVLGGDRRDPRSDVTRLVGITYYCLTGIPPSALRDAADQPPHRRRGQSISEKLGDDPAVRVIENFFDTGFQQHIDNRFQTVEQLRKRLISLRNLGTETQPIDLGERFEEAATLFLQLDRPTQLISYQPGAAHIMHELQKAMGEIRLVAKKTPHQPFSFRDHSLGSLVDLPEGVDKLVDIAFRVGLSGSRGLNEPGVAYAVGARGIECIVYRATFEFLHEKRQQLKLVSPWEELHAYPGSDTKPDAQPAIRDLKACINSIITDLPSKAFDR